MTRVAGCVCGARRRAIRQAPCARFVVREARVKRLLLVMVALVGVAGCGRGDQLPTSASVAPSQSSTVAMPAFLRVTGRPTSSMMAVVWRNGVATITSRLQRPEDHDLREGRALHAERLTLAVVRNYRDGVRLKDMRRGHPLARPDLTDPGADPAR